ncbi:echinoderm microtubule-associated protein-like CG42247 [Babylonia areolata]|uniref:echinoderm microtubule-associated protein-like CG42247 n=1 Tax=Babylonia areolata TaxID=304850 RepID=UPI003FD671E8
MTVSGSDVRLHNAHRPSHRDAFPGDTSTQSSSAGQSHNPHHHYLDVQRMAAPMATDFASRNHLIQQIHLSQQRRAASSPYSDPLLKEPGQLQPSYPAKDPTSFHSGQGDPYLQPLDPPAHRDPHRHLDSRQPANMTDSSRVNDKQAFLNQTRVDTHDNRGYGSTKGHGGDLRTTKGDPYHDDNYYDGLSDPYSKLHIAAEPGNRRDQPGGTGSDTLLPSSRLGSMTDDDKMNETGKGEEDQAEVMSDSEVERRLEELRQIHDERLETAQRLAQNSSDVTHNVHAPSSKGGVNGNPHTQQKEEYNSSETESLTPTNQYLPEQLDPPSPHPSKELRGGNYYPNDHHPVNGDPHSIHTRLERPPPHHSQHHPPFHHNKVYYPRSKPPRQYDIAQPRSEPSYSRNASPRSEDHNHRAQSQQYLRLVNDSYDPSYDSSADNPGITFDRYARRATRASVLSKAEQLLNARKQSTKLDSISELRGNPPAGQAGQSSSQPSSRKRRRRRRKVAFIEEEEGSADSDQSKDEGFPLVPVTSFPVTRGSKGGAGGRRDRLQEANARIKRRPSTDQRSGIPVRRHVPRGKAAGGRQVHDDYNQNSSASASEDDEEDEEDVVHYGPAMFEDSSRYELARAYRPLTLPDRDPEQQEQAAGKKGRRVKFFRNGFPDEKGRQVLINRRNYPTFETLLVDLSGMEMAVRGVRYIYKWPGGKEITSVTEFENGCSYVCSNENRLIEVNYGQARELNWKYGKMDRQEKHLYNDKAADTRIPQSRQKPYMMTVVSNLCRESREKVFLGPNTTQNYEDLLADMHILVHVPYPPVQALFTESKPRVKVEGFSHLFRLLKEQQKVFLVVGEEEVPIEPKKRPLLPSSDSSTNGSVHSKGSQRHPKQSKADMATARSGDSPPNRRVGLQRMSEPVRCEINGKRREFYAPSSVLSVDNDGRKPHKKFKLDWVYGFRGHDVGQNLVLLPHTDELVYFVASVVVLYDRFSHSQRHYMGHTEEVTCLALHPYGPFIASGQMAGRTPEGAAHIRVWNAMTLNIVSVIGIGAFQGGVSCVSFSKEGLLLAVDESDRHVLSLWKWGDDEDKPLAQTKTTIEHVTYGCFYPFDESILITFGKQHLYFWKVFRERLEGPIRRDTKSGIFEEETPMFVTSVCFSADCDVITGDSRGTITVWCPDEEDIFRVRLQVAESTKFAHKKYVSCLVMLTKDILLSGGGNEIKAWDVRRDYMLILERVLPQVHGAVRKIVPLSPTGLDGHIFLGTTRNVVLEGTLQSMFRVIVQGHSGELKAVRSHPTERSFFTAGHDRTLVKWSDHSHRVTWITKARNPCSSLSVHPRGLLMAVGTTTGVVTMYGCADGKERNSIQVGKAQVNALSFSRDGKQLAVGCDDGFVHVCVVHEDGQIYRLRSSPLGHGSTSIKHLDWSSDGRYLQTALGDHDLVFWDVSNMQKKTMTWLRDVLWFTFTCPVGYPLVGPWRKLKRGEWINVACRSKDLGLLATGDNLGRVRLFKYPSTSMQPDCRQIKPFSSNVTAAEFLYGESSMVVAGGCDAALMQYHLEDR